MFVLVFPCVVRHWLRGSGVEGGGGGVGSLPWDVVLECVVSLCVGVVGCVLWSGGRMQGIVAAPTFHLRATDSVYGGGQWDIRALHHRGRALKEVRRGKAITDLLLTPHT